MATQKLRICLRAYDHVLIDKASERIVDTLKNSGAGISGPVPLPTRRSLYVVNRSPHVDKKSREQFEAKVHKRLIDIISSTPKAVEALTRLELPAGVDVEIKQY